MEHKKESSNTSFEQQYDVKSEEKSILQFWEQNDIYKFNNSSSKVVFSIDTPPPTMSGRMHIGHAFSYTQTDFIARYKRMRGYEVFYPFGTDDNGLATEKLVQKDKGVDLRKLTREEAVEITMKYLDENRPQFVSDWKQLGISCDFDNLEYSTISPEVQKISQESFLTLVNNGLVERRKGPIPWDRVFQTTIAQAELEDKEVKSKMNYIKAKVVHSNNTYIIYATTRPEMIFACHGFSVEDSGEYVKLKVNNEGQEEFWILGAQTYETVMSLMNTLVSKIKIQNIVFDVDGVLIKSEKSKKEVYKTYFSNLGLSDEQFNSLPWGFNRRYLLEYVHNTIKKIDIEKEYEVVSTLLEEIEDTFEWNEKLLSFIKKNKDSFVYYVNSSLPKKVIERLFEKKNIRHLFKECYGGEIKKSENFKELFSNINASETLFVDDKIEHIKTAQEHSTHTHHFIEDTDIQQLISTIEKSSTYEVVETLTGQEVIGEKVIIPLINREITITHDQSIKADLGTGAAYFCSFGGVEDIEYVKRHPDIPIHEIMNKDGTLNELCGDCEGLVASEEGRFAVMRKLKELGVMVAQESITQIVNVGERSGAVVEYIASEQWFVKYLDKKEMFFEFSEQFNWTPRFMKSRMDNWIKGLSWDWGVSRQRHFGIPIPAWINIKTNAVVYPLREMLPLDPTQTSIPQELCEEGFSPQDYRGESDVFDTWFTSATTPTIGARLVKGGEEKLFPMNLRPQAHDIINFWLFYTMAKNNLMYNKNPFKDVAISGWVLAADGTKMSKSKGNTISPQEIVEKYSNDALRFAAASTKLGQDIPFQEKEVKTGMGVANKIYNSVKFASMLLDDFNERDRRIEYEKLNGVDKGIVSKLQIVSKESNEAFEKYEYSKAKSLWTDFFMNDVCNDYLEIVKQRLWRREENYKSAQRVLYKVLLDSIKGLSPILPFISENVYQNFFKQFEKENSIHNCSYPQLDINFKESKEQELYDVFILVINKVRGFKSNAQISLKESLKEISIKGDNSQLKFIKSNIKDLENVTNTKNIELENSETFEVELS